MIAFALVHREVPRGAEPVKELGDERGRRATLGEALDEPSLRVIRAFVEAEPGRGVLGKDLAEEAELGEASAGIVGKEAFGLRAEEDEVRIVIAEKLEVG